VSDWILEARRKLDRFIAGQKQPMTDVQARQEETVRRLEREVGRLDRAAQAAQNDERE
jgi:hypothetical protein